MTRQFPVNRTRDLTQRLASVRPNARVPSGYKVLIALKGRCPIVGAAPPAPAAALRERLAFNVAIENPLIIVHGDTATSQVIFTEYRQEKSGRADEVYDSGKGVRDLGQGERPVALQDPSDRERQ